MKVLLLNQVFYPDVAATAQHGHDLARHLIAQGHTVQAIASRSIYGQTGAVLPKHEIVDGIEIHRVGKNRFGRSNNFARFLDFAMFYVAATFKAMRIQRPDVVVCFTTPPLIALVGWLMRALRRCKFVYWVMDLYPDLPIACDVMKERGLIARISEMLHRFVLRRADCCVVLGRCMKQRVLAKGVVPEKIRVIHVWSDGEEIKPLPRAGNAYRLDWKLGDAFVVMYSGNYGVGHEMFTILDAVRKLALRKDIKFVFAGGGVRKKEVEQYIHDYSLANAQSQPYQPRERLGELLGAADLHLSSQAEHMAGLFVPSKLYGVLAAGRPMVFVGNADAENALVLTENDCGKVIRNGDSDALADLIQQLACDPDRAEEMGRRGREALLAKYSREDGCTQWEQLLLDVVHQSPQPDAHPEAARR